METLAYRFLRVFPSKFKLERYFELFCVKFVGRRQAGESFCFINPVVRYYNQGMDHDEVALNALLAEGIDVPTAIAGSIDDGCSEPVVKDSSFAHVLGLAAALIVTLLLLFWLA